MIIFARAPGTTGWVEIKPEEELSHRGQFWEIRKFAVESDDALPLARRLDRAEQALRMAGFKYHGPSEKWLTRYDGAFIPENELLAILPGNCYLDEPDGGSVTVLGQFRRMAADAARYRWLRSAGPDQQRVISHYALAEMDKTVDRLKLAEGGVA